MEEGHSYLMSLTKLASKIYLVRLEQFMNHLELFYLTIPPVFVEPVRNSDLNGVMVNCLDVARPFRLTIYDPGQIRDNNPFLRGFLLLYRLNPL